MLALARSAPLEGRGEDEEENPHGKDGYPGRAAPRVSVPSAAFGGQEGSRKSYSKGDEHADHGAHTGLTATDFSDRGGAYRDCQDARTNLPNVLRQERDDHTCI
jgi:hypothetical protein